MLDVVQPFELMLNPFCCTGFLRVVHHHKRLIFITYDVIFFMYHSHVVMQNHPWKKTAILTIF